MSQPPAVKVDLVLDQYLGKIFPKSLVPTAGYIILLALGVFFISGFVWRLVAPTTSKQHDD